MRKLKIIGGLCGLICLLAGTVFGQMIVGERLFGRYQQFVWQDQHGLPQNGISAIVQTPDGYLWLAIAEGVARFDGVRFTTFDTGNTPEIKSNNVQSLLVDRSGTLWIGTHGGDGGLTRYRDGIFTSFSAAEGLSDSHVRSIFEDRAGNLWVGTDGGGLNLLRDGKFTVYSTADGLPDNRIGALTEDAEGNLWIGTNNGLAKFKDGQFTVYQTRDGLAGNNIRALFYDREGNLWAGGAGGLSRLRQNRVETFGAKDGLKNSHIGSIAGDGENTLWFGTIDGGLYRFNNGKFEACTTREGLVSDIIQAIYPDSAGNLWLGTSGGGLAQLRAGRFSVFTRAAGLPDDLIGAIYEDRAGGVWVGSDTGLSRYKDGKFTVINAPGNQPLRGIHGIGEDADGNLWVNSSNAKTGDKVLKFRENDSTIEIVRNNVFDNRAAVILHDRAGNVWYGTSHDGLHRIGHDGGETVFRKSEGLADDYVNALYEDRAGGIWIGTRGGLSQFQNGVLRTFTSAEGFNPASHVISFHEDAAGNLWVGTHGDGLFRFRDGKFVVFKTKDGLYDNLAFQILEDAAGNLWMSGNKGIYRASITELEDFAAGRRAAVNSFAYGSADGMLSRECNGANPAGVKTRDGLFWFPTIKGVVVVDPRRTDERQPNVVIEQTLIDSRVLPVGETAKMQPGQDNLEIHFTALSWNRPQQIRFKYQLVDLDADWVEAGTRRTAYYAHLPPGEYVFRVSADNGEGVWSTTDKTLSVVVLPPFYRTWWFVALCALTVILAIRLIYSYRVAQLEKINAARAVFTRQLIEQQEQERRRIAVELHDSIGQSLSIIRNRALLALKTPGNAERLAAQMEEISETTVETIQEVRQISHNLHPHQLESLGLTAALESMIETATEVSGTQFDFEIDDVDGVLTGEAEINLYRIVQECVNNILKHSGATIAKISLKRVGGVVRLSIEDNGKGFQPENYKQTARGLGLTGIAERAKMLNAQHEIRSASNIGTTVSLQIYLPQPYRTDNGKLSI